MEIVIFAESPKGKQNIIVFEGGGYDALISNVKKIYFWAEIS